MRFWKLAALVATVAVSACGGGRSPSGSDLAVSGTGPTVVVLGGATVTFTMVVTNAGGNTANDVKIVNSIGNQLALTGITCSAAGGATCPAVPTVSMDVGSMSSGSSLTFAVSATVSQTANGTLTNTMSATVADDSNRANNSTTAQATAFSAAASIVVSGTGPVDTVPGGASASFTMTVRNDGPDAGTNLRIVDTVGGNLTLANVTCTAAGAAVCPTPGVSMSVPTLPYGGSLVFAITAVVAQGTSGVISNTMTVTLDNDSSRTDNTAVATGTAFTARSGVSVAGAGPAAPVYAGENSTFAMTVLNIGPDPATNVRIVDTVGGNLTLIGLTCSASLGATCPATLGPGMTVPTLAVNASLTFYVTTVVAVGTNGGIANTMSATPDSDPDRGDNTAVATGSALSNNVSVAATAPIGPISGGAPATFVMLVSNTGPSTATNVQLTNTVGTNLAPGTIACTASGGAICPPTLGASMVAPSIPVNGTLSFAVGTIVNAGANGSAADAMTAVASGDARAADNTATATVTVVSADLGVSQTVAATIAAGSPVTFTAIVANPGPGPANNLTIVDTLSPGTYPVTVTCTPSVGAVCPTTLGQNMTLASLPAGRALSISYTVTIPTADRGNIVNTVSVTGNGDPQTANNTATTTTVAVDARSGTYRAYATDGNGYDMTIDFDAGIYTMSGTMQNVQRTFTADASGGGYTVAGESRFRSAPDLIVGGHDFGHGVLPYVAARSFVTSVSQFTGQYNLATRNVTSSTGTAITHAGTARAASNVLQVCQTDDGFVQVTQQCGLDLKTYNLTLSDDLITGVETTTSEVIKLRVARSGAALVLLSAGVAPDTTLQFRIGLPDSSGLAGGSLGGASTDGTWINVAMTSSTYSFISGSQPSTTFGLQVINAQGPFAMLQDASYPPQYYVLQSVPIAVMLGALGQPTSGLMQISVP